MTFVSVLTGVMAIRAPCLQYTSRFYPKHQVRGGGGCPWCLFPFSRVTKSLSEPKHRILLKNTVGHREGPTLHSRQSPLPARKQREPLHPVYVCMHLGGGRLSCSTLIPSHCTGLATPQWLTPNWQASHSQLDRRS